MDILRELAVREGMFEVLDQRVALSADGNLSWQQTERFIFAGETFAMRQARGKGINKPRRLGAALSITTAYRGPRSQRPYEDSIGEDGYPRYKYELSDPDLATNRAMRAAMEVGLPLTYSSESVPPSINPSIRCT
jgi:putative restriction endonuclease